MANKVVHKSKNTSFKKFIKKQKQNKQTKTGIWLISVTVNVLVNGFNGNCHHTCVCKKRETENWVKIQSDKILKCAALI